MGRKSEEKKSFKLYNDYKEHFDLMTDEEAGKVIKAILAYVNHEELPEMNGAVRMAFSFIEAQLDRDRMAYDKRCETNKANGSKGGRPRAAEKATAEEKEPEESEKNPEKPNGFDGFSEKNDETVGKEKRAAKKEYPEGFKRFWDIYPRKANKGACYEKYSARLKDGYSPEELEAAAVAYRAECEREHTPEQYIKHGKTFLGPTGAFEEYLRKDTKHGKETYSDGYEKIDFNDYL